MQGLEIRITHFRFWYSVGKQKLPNRFVYISATHCFFRNIWEKQKQIDIFLWKRLFLFVTWTYVAHSGQQEIVQLYGLTTSVWVLTSKYDVLFKIIFEIKINFRYIYLHFWVHTNWEVQKYFLSIFTHSQVIKLSATWKVWRFVSLISVSITL